MSLLFLLYGILAALAFWATCRDEYLRWIGLWLVAGWGFSNMLDFSRYPVPGRVGPYTAIEIMVAVAASWALIARSRWLIGILVFNLISIAANIGLALNYPPTDYQIYLWKSATNLCFAAECLFAVGIGVGHGFRTGRFRRWFFLRREPAETSAAKGADS